MVVSTPHSTHLLLTVRYSESDFDDLLVFTLYPKDFKALTIMFVRVSGLAFLYSFSKRAIFFGFVFGFTAGAFSTIVEGIALSIDSETVSCLFSRIASKFALSARL